MAETVFDKILRGEIPSHKLYEDEHVFALLDIAPLSFGHALVIPKERAKTLDQLSDDSAAALGRVLPRLCRAIKRLTGTSAYNVLENNESAAHQAVSHVHFHIIPKPDEKSGLGIGWPAGKLDHAQGADFAAKVRAELGG
ncbi:MAG TPA: HIT family protein [Polyangiaceae bacterium]|jgi:histidine triad (HIT) family protein|nr:HIT family protein [Polyangiaceae bacterium]